MMKTPELYLFDMDHTLIDADCDVTWKSYAVAHKLAPANALEVADRFFDDYNAGTLDEAAFMRFQFAEFIGRTPEEMAAESRRHFAEFIRPRCYDKARRLVAELLAQSFPVAILTSTNTVLARPVAEFFGIRTVLGTTLALRDGRFNGEIVGAYAAGAGKLAPARAWAADNGHSLAEVAYYGDSINDRNLLTEVGFPVAANPSDALLRLAVSNHWTVVRF